MKLQISLCYLLISYALISNAQEHSQSTEIRVNVNINGTLLTPETPTKDLVIIIPGSGPTDRDGNQQMTRNNSLKLLATGLAKKGIASYRYDKRVLTLIRRNALKEDKLSFDMFIEDAIATVDFFKKENRFSNIYIIGHSQGSLVGMVAAQQIEVTGFISLSGPGQAIDKTIINQVALQMPDLKEKAEEAFNTLKTKGKVTDYSPALASIFRPSVQPFMASWMQYNPQEEIAKLDGENVLIITGTKDIQISEEEATLLQKGNPKATLVTIPKMNHVLRIIEGGDLENTKSYNLSALPISEDVVTHIEQFIKKN